MTYFPGAPNERSFAYIYDVAGNTISLKENTEISNLVEYSNFTAAGQPGTAIFPKPGNVSVKTTYTYYPDTTKLHTIISQKFNGGTPVATYQNLIYAYDHKINITSIQDNANGITHAFGYDSLDRLETAIGTGNNPYSQSYGYDRLGNILSKSDVGSYTYDYADKPHAVRSAGNMTLQYDDFGNMIQKSIQGGATISISYNFLNMPALIQQNGNDFIAFSYDGYGERVKKHNLSTGDVTQYFGASYEQRGTVGIIHLFVGNNRIVSLRSDGKDQYYHPNHLGSASVVTDANGDIKERIEYYPFGTYREDVSYDPQFPAVNYTFTDQEDDDELGFYNFKARLYDPLLGRFLSADSNVPDPGQLQTLNRYSYCANNPVVYMDPSGHDFGISIIIGVIIGVVVGTIAAGIQSNWNPQATVIGAAIGGAAGGLGGAVGGQFGAMLSGIVKSGAMSGLTASIIAGAAGGAAAGTFAGGVGALIGGGNFGNFIEGSLLGGLSGAAIGGIMGGLAYALNGSEVAPTQTVEQNTQKLDSALTVRSNQDSGFEIYSGGEDFQKPMMADRLGRTPAVIDYGSNPPKVVYPRNVPGSFDVNATLYEAGVETINDFFNNPIQKVVDTIPAGTQIPGPKGSQVGNRLAIYQIAREIWNKYVYPNLSWPYANK